MDVLREQFVEAEIAILARDNGFDEECLAWQCVHNGEIIFDDGALCNGVEYSLAILHQQLQEWFREKHNIFISIELASYVNDFNYRFIIETFDNKIEGHKTNSYNQALTQAFKEAFEIIKK